jgi:hypothetical protein
MLATAATVVDSASLERLRQAWPEASILVR